MIYSVKHVFGIVTLVATIFVLSLSWHHVSASLLHQPKIYTDRQKPIILTRTQSEFQIKLPANPSTGYLWFLVEYDPQYIVPIKQIYLSTKVDKIGADGYDIWTFRAKPVVLVVPHVTRIKLIQAKPWEMEHGKSTTFVVISQT